MNANLQLLLKAFTVAISLRTVDASGNTSSIVTFRDDYPIDGMDTDGGNVSDSEAGVARDAPISYHDTAKDVFWKALITYAASSLMGILICCTCMKCCGHLSSTASWEIVDSGGGQKIFKRIQTPAGQIPSYTLLADEKSLRAAHLADQDELMPAGDEEAMTTRPQENADPRSLQVDSGGDSRPNQSYFQSSSLSEALARTLALVSLRRT